jgi:hypothetical protein
MASSLAADLKGSPPPAMTLAMRWRRAWPLPALAAWALAWLLWRLAAEAGLPAPAATAGAALAGALVARRAATRTRRLVVALGFPLSLALVGLVGNGPAWLWLLPAGALALAYPMSAWRDAPLFPTPAAALAELPHAAPLPTGSRVLDAGCGLGHGLAALRQAYPTACIDGVERSAPLAWLSRLRQPWARIVRGDMWAHDWSGYALVYLFQRPETLPRALAKAQREMAGGSWLASLEFEAAGVAPAARLRTPDGRALWLYRITPGTGRRSQAQPSRADKNANKARPGSDAAGR